MPLSDVVARWLEKPAVRKFLEEKSTIGIFFSIVAGVVAVAGVLGKIFALNETVARWLSKALTTDATTRAPKLRLWFEPFVFLEIFALAALALLILWAFTRRFAWTKDQVALEEFMSAVRQIRDQGKQPRIKAWDTLSFIYLIDRNFSGSLTRVSVMKAVDVPVHFSEIVHSVEDEADGADSLAAVNYQARDLASPTTNIVYLPSENGKRKKKACMFFLPPIQPGESRTFEITYQWPGMFKRLKKNSENIEFTSNTRDTLRHYRLEVYLQEGTGGRLDCTIAGDVFPDQNLAETSYRQGAWSGHGYVYEVRDIPPGNLHLALKVQVRN